jgi:hypothetical protein
MPLDQEAIDQQQKLLVQQRHRLALLHEQQAKLGAYTPPYVVIDIREAQAAIGSIKAALRAGGALVEDAPIDDASLAAVATQAAPSLHRLRAPVGDFVGRAAEIDQLVQALLTAAHTGAAAAISGVRGMGGIGKTELAYVVANQLKPLFPDAQLVSSSCVASSGGSVPRSSARIAGSVKRLRLVTSSAQPGGGSSGRTCAASFASSARISARLPSSTAA